MSAPVTIEGQLAFPSRYIGAADLGGRDTAYTIENVRVDELMLQGGRKTKKPVLYFKGTEKMLVCNKTNAVQIAKQYGGEMKAWIGRQIVLYPTTTKFGRETVPCVRVRPGAAADEQEPEQTPPGDSLDDLFELAAEAARLAGECVKQRKTEAEKISDFLAGHGAKKWAELKPDVLVKAIARFKDLLK